MRQVFRPSGSVAIAVAAAALAAVTLACSSWFGVAHPTIPALSYLLVVVVVAAYSRLWVALASSVASVLLLNYFFVPPTRTFVVGEPENWVALFVLLVVSLIASQLSASVRSRAMEATARRDELARLFDLSRDILLMTESASVQARLAQAVGRRFDLPYAAVCLRRDAGWSIEEADRSTVALSSDLLEDIFRDAVLTSEADPRHTGRHTTQGTHGAALQAVPIRVGGKAVGLLVVGGRRVDAGTLDAVAGVAAIAVERVELLEERRRATVARESGELKSALLASLAHDLRTPLTAIQVAASNLQAGWAEDAERRAQSEIVLGEVGRLNRLFQNILDMARIETRGVTAEREWVTPEEIVEAAVTQVRPALEGHELASRAADDVCVHVDPRLTSTALARLLENAAQYSPEGARISVEASADAGGLRVVVEDEGRGIAPEEAPRLFEGFFRGRAAAGRPSGAGLGLAISRGLVAAEGGSVGGENRLEGGARFWIAVPAPVRPGANEP